jgi:hydroxyacyl-ACP dehydratase HTD2-like protein with hotdog domain
LRTIEFRAVNPLFEGLPVTIAGVADNERIEMTAVRNDGAVAMTSILT